MNKKVLFKSEKHDYETPKDLFDKYHSEYHFKIDLAASKDNKKLDKYLGLDKGENALQLDWWPYKRCWLNPPYGRHVDDWIRKCHEEMYKGCLIVALLASRTDTIWFHKYVYNQPFIRYHFLKGRVKFVGMKDAAPFPSVVVIFDGESLTGGSEKKNT